MKINFLNWEKNFHWILAFIFCFFIIIFEPLQFGFDFKGHRGWVDSHGASIIMKSSVENNFVGYSLDIEIDGKPDKYYFDRYPFFFSAITKLILSPFESSPSLWVYFSKVWMNLVFLMFALYVFRIIDLFSGDKKKSFLILVFSLSGYYFFFYKSMIHFDQPAILGMAITSFYLLRFEKTGNRKGLFWACLLTPLMGRGYVTLFIITLYFILKLVMNFKNLNIKRYLREVALLIVIPGVVCSSFLTYNIFQEAQTRNVGIEEVSIVKSAKARVGVKKFEDEGREKSVSLGKFVLDQSYRNLRLLAPAIISFNKNLTYIFIIPLIFFLIRYRQKIQEIYRKDKLSLTFLLLSGPVWLFPMKRLAAFHDYTTMYMWGLAVVFYYLVFNSIKLNRKRFYGLLLIPLISLLTIYFVQNKNTQKINSLAQELDEITKFTQGQKGKFIYSPEGHRLVMKGRPYIMGFYFKDLIITDDRDKSDFVLTSMPNIDESALTLLYRGQFLSLYRRD